MRTKPQEEKDETEFTAEPGVKGSCLEDKDIPFITDNSAMVCDGSIFAPIEASI